MNAGNRYFTVLTTISTISREMLALLEGIQDGTVSFKNGGLSIPCGTQADITGGPGMEMDGEKYNVPKPARESGDLDHEKEV